MTQLPEFWVGRTPPPEYYADIDPFAPAECPFDLPAMTNYAREHGVAVSDLNRDEVMKFLIGPLHDWMCDL